MADSDRTTKALLAAVVLCAIAMTGMAGYRTFGMASSAGARLATPGNAPVDHPVADWPLLLATGHRMGADSAPLTILEFADFECPACRRFFVGALEPVEKLHPGQIAVVFRHWPLPYHRFAYPAARAAECAAAQGRFASFHDLVYHRQDSLGLKSFESFAREAGVPDAAAFGKCLAVPGHVAAVDADSAAVIHLGGHGTPTIIANGVMLAGIPDSARLERMLEDARKDRKSTP